MASLVAETIKNLPAIQETWVWSLGWEDLLEKNVATHSSILAWRIPMDREPGELQSMRLQSQTWLSNQVHYSPWIIFFYFLAVFVGFAYQFWGFIYIVMSSNSEILSPVMNSLLVSPLKAFFISATVFLISGISLWFLPRISISLHTLSIYFCMLSTLSMSVFSISIIDLSRFWYNSHVPAMSDSATSYVSSSCAFPLLVCLVIFYLIGTKNCYK